MAVNLKRRILRMISPKKQQVDGRTMKLHWFTIHVSHILRCKLPKSHKLSGFSWHLWYIFTPPPGKTIFLYELIKMIQMIGWKYQKKKPLDMSIGTSRFFTEQIHVCKHDTTRTQFFKNILVCSQNSRMYVKNIHHRPPPSCYLLTSKIPAHKINGAGIICTYEFTTKINYPCIKR